MANRVSDTERRVTGAYTAVFPVVIQKIKDNVSPLHTKLPPQNRNHAEENLTYTHLAFEKVVSMPATQRPRVLLLIPHLGGGGAERVTALLAHGLSREKYEIHLGLVTQGEAGAEFALREVEVHALGAHRVRAGAFRLLRLVRRLRPQLILSGMAHLNFMVLLLRPSFPRQTRILVRQNSTASAAMEFGGLPFYTRFLYRLLYRRADCVICQTTPMASDLAHELGIPEARLVVLPNPIDIEAIRARVNVPPSHWPQPDSAGPHLLAVGRLSREKGFDLLLQALARVRESFPSADLLIAGAGPEESSLKAQCRELGLESAVHFAGYVEQPAAFFPRASVFVLSSRHEGLPNALLEAAAGGLPIVALPSSEGVADLLRGQPGVWLAPEISASALADTLLATLNELRPGQRFVHSFVEQFGLERAIGAYEALIDSLLGEARR
jgi:glycosyltransferase involved in cell wall biosynthesis